MLNCDDDFNIQSTYVDGRYVCTILYTGVTYIVDTTAFDTLLEYVYNFYKQEDFRKESFINLGFGVEKTSILRVRVIGKKIFIDQSHNNSSQPIYMYDLLWIISEVGYLLSQMTYEYLVDFNAVKISSGSSTFSLPISMCESLVQSFFKSYNTTYVQLTEGSHRIKVFKGLVSIYTLEKVLLTGIPFYMFLLLCMRVVLERNLRDTSYRINPDFVKWKSVDGKFTLSIHDWFSLVFLQDFIPTLEEFVFGECTNRFLSVSGFCYMNAPCFLRRTSEYVYLFANNVFHLICAIPVSVFKECLLCYIDDVIVPAEKYSLANNPMNSVCLLCCGDTISLESGGRCIFTFTRRSLDKVLEAFSVKVPAVVINVKYMGNSVLCRVVQMNGGAQFRLPDYPHVRYYISDYSLSHIL